MNVPIPVYTYIIHYFFYFAPIIVGVYVFLLKNSPFTLFISPQHIIYRYFKISRDRYKVR